MLKKNIKKFLCILEMIILLLGCRLPNVLAMEADNKNIISLETKVAYLTDIDEYGEKWKNESITEGKYVKHNKELEIVTDEKQLDIKVAINGETVNIKGNACGKNENGNIIYFQGNIDSPKYEIIAFSYESDINNSNIYFDSMQENAEHVLKIYLKDVMSEKRDYIILECFEYVIQNEKQIINDLPENSLLGAWGAREFKAISQVSNTEDILETTAMTSSFTRIITKTFYEGVVKHTHKITLRFTADYMNIAVGGEANQIYRITVAGKSMSVPDAPNLNSSTQSYLHVGGVELRQTSVPYTAWSSTTIDGVVNKVSSGGTLSAGIGVNLGALSLSYSVTPSSFTNKGTIDINKNFTTYENYGTNFTRCICTKMGSSFILTQKDHYFYIKSVLRDYGNATRSAQSAKNTWIIKIVNGSSLETSTYSYSQDVSIAIK